MYYHCMKKIHIFELNNTYNKTPLNIFFIKFNLYYNKIEGSEFGYDTKFC